MNYKKSFKWLGYIFFILIILTSLDANAQVNQQATQYYNQGYDFFNKGDDEQAISYFTAAIKADPTMVNAYFYRGVSEYYLKRYNEAIKDFAEVINRDKYSSDGYLYSALTYLKLKDNNNAISNLTQLLSLNPDDSQASYLLGSIYYNNRDNANAQKYYNDAVNSVIKIAAGQGITLTADDVKKELPYYDDLAVYFLGLI